MTDTIPEHTPTGWKGGDNLLGWADIIGQEHAKRVIEVALAGGHSAFLIGNRGSQAEDLAAWGRAHGGKDIYAAYPCACGYYGDPKIECTCSVRQIAYYRGKRFPKNPADITIELPRVADYQIAGHLKHGCVPWAKTKSNIEAAMARRADPAYRSVTLDEICNMLLSAAVRQLALGEGEVMRIRAVARTIANLAGEKTIQTSHLAEAIQYRSRS